MAKLNVACVQTNPGESVAANVKEAFTLVRRAACEGAQVIVLPEVFTYMGSDAGRIEGAQVWGTGVFHELSALAEELGIFLVGGSHAERPVSGEVGKVFNTCGLFNPLGLPLAVYRKMHLFNLWGAKGEKLFCESDVYLEGDGVVGCDICHETSSWRANISICYDLRFPEIFRQPDVRLRPWDILFLPAAFVYETGRHHWEVLLRARAIENQCYVVACNQTGPFMDGKKRNYGHSMVIDPWGQVVASLGEEVGILHATLDTALIAESRTRLAALKNRRL